MKKTPPDAAAVRGTRGRGVCHLCRLAWLLALALVSAGPAWAQRGDFEITKVQPAVVKTPEYQVSPSAANRTRSKEWLEVEVQFRAEPEFTDELTFKYYILLLDKLLVGEVTHINIPQARELYSVMYVPPRNIERILEGRPLTAATIKDVGVQILNRGALVAEKSFKSNQMQWWQTMQQVPGMVVNKNDSPFAPLNWDRYEAIKPSR